MFLKELLFDKWNRRILSETKQYRIEFNMIIIGTDQNYKVLLHVGHTESGHWKCSTKG